MLFSGAGEAGCGGVAHVALERAGAGNALYELSADGETWTSHRTSVEAPPATVGATVEDIIDAADPDPAIIDGIDICP